MTNMQSATLTYLWKTAKNFRQGRNRPIQSIILHATEGHKKGDLSTLLYGDGRQVSVHWYVTRAGEIYHFVQDGDTAFHAGRVAVARYSNDGSIGIEQEHITASDDWPDIQVQAVANLIAFIRQKHGPLEMVSHAKAAYPPGRKSDPEPYPWDKLLAHLSSANTVHWVPREVAA